MKPNNYDRIAWCYDLLSKIVFGNKIKRAQIDLLKFIPANSNILIAGGGTGWILEEITKVHQSGLVITYIDASEKMVQKSKKRKRGLNKLEYISKPIEQVQLAPGNYDVIITPFFFDNFSQTAGLLIFQQLHVALKKEGIWLFVDFMLNLNEKYWQKPMLNFMYLFFRKICRLQTMQLPDSNMYFSAHGYEKLAMRKYYRDFIISTVFKRPNQSIP